MSETQPFDVPSPKKVMIAFLGASRYVPCQYEFPALDGNLPNDKCRSPQVTYVQSAVKWYLSKKRGMAAQCKVFCTKDAEKMHWDALVAEFVQLNLEPPEKIQIPDGDSNEGLQTIFLKICAAVSEGDEIVFDTTHSFRSLPIVMTLVVNYLAIAKNVRLLGCYYGAFERFSKDVVEWFAQNKKQVASSVKINDESLIQYGFPDSLRIAPVFDLTRFFRLNEWSQAISEFLNYSSATRLTTLSREMAQEDGTVVENENRLSALEVLNDFCQNVRLGNLRGLLDQTKSFEQTCSLIGAYKSKVPQLVPVLDRLREALVGYGSTELEDGLRAARWAAEHDLIPQAYTMLQETIDSALMEYCSPELNELGLPLTGADARKGVSAFLGYVQRSKKRKPWHIKGDIDQTVVDKWERDFPRDILPIYGKITSIRNSLTHCGMTNNRVSSDSSDLTAEGCKGWINQLASVLPLLKRHEKRI